MIHTLWAAAAACFAEAVYFLSMRPIDDLPLGVICIASGSALVSASGRLVQWRMKRRLAQAQRELAELQRQLPS